MPTKQQAQKEKKVSPLKPFSKEQFRYNPDKDEYICPEGKILKYKGIAFSDPDKIAYKAAGKECRSCRYFGICTTSRDGRRIVRLINEQVKEKIEQVYKTPQAQKIYTLRKQKVELPFGHMKHNLGAGQFLLRGSKGVNAELSILSTCFNIARMITIIGIPTLMSRLNGI